MVDITEVQEVMAQNQDATTSSSANEKDPDGWEKLMGDDLLLKIIHKSQPLGGKDPEHVNPQDAVLIDLVGRISKDKFDTDGPVIQEAKGWMVVVGDGDVLPCIEMAIRFMQSGDTGRVWSHSKYAMGPGTRKYSVNDETKQLPPNSSVMYEIKVNMIVMDTSRLNPYFTIQKATTRKSIANDIYEHEWCPAPASTDEPTCTMAMARAVRIYTKSAKEMENLLQGTYFSQVESDHPQRHQTRQLLMDSLNNIVAVHLRQHQYHTAKQAAIEVLRQDPKNVKALLRAAKAALFDPASTLEEVEAALKAAEGEITYKNPSEEKQLKQIKMQFKKKRHEYKEQSKAMFGDKLKTSNAFSSEEDAPADGTKMSKSKNVVGSVTSGKSVSFDESTTKPPSEKGTQNGDTTMSDSRVWLTQGFSILFQAVLPIFFYFIYRMIARASGGMGESSRAGTPQVDEELGDGGVEF